MRWRSCSCARSTARAPPRRSSSRRSSMPLKAACRRATSSLSIWPAGERKPWVCRSTCSIVSMISSSGCRRRRSSSALPSRIASTPQKRIRNWLRSPGTLRSRFAVTAAVNTVAVTSRALIAMIWVRRGTRFMDENCIGLCGPRLKWGVDPIWEPRPAPDTCRARES